MTTLFVRYITTNKNYPPFYFIIYSAILGLSSFVILEVIHSVYHIIRAVFNSEIKLYWNLNLTIWDSIMNGKSEFKTTELLSAYIVAIPFGLFIGYLTQHKSLNKILQFLKLTTRFGDGDVWSHFLNMEEVEWLIVRDKQSNLAYFGSVRSYSEANDKREILLEEVDVYTSDTWEKLYTSKAVFLELNDKQFSIELPIEVNKNIEDGK